MACSSYCDFNEKLTSQASEATGLPRCIMGTIPPAILLLAIVAMAMIQLCKRRRIVRHTVADKRRLVSDAESGDHDVYFSGSSDATDSMSKVDKNKPCSCALRCQRIDGTCDMENCSVHYINPAAFVHGDSQTSFLYTLQQFLHICIVVLPIIDLITKAAMKPERLQGYVVVSDGSTLFTWLLAFFVLRAEGYRYFKNCISRHSLGMLGFWTGAFIVENLAFLSIHNDNWWFGHKNSIQEIEFGLFVTKYSILLLVFLLGLKAPGLYRVVTPPIPVNEAASDGLSGTRMHRKSTFKDLWLKTKMIWPFLWPSQRTLQLRVVICFIVLGVGRVVNILVPYTYKEIVNHITPGVEVNITNPVHLILIYVFLRFLQGGGTGGVGLLNNIRSFVWIRVQQFTSRTLQVRLFAHLHSLSLSWHLNRKTGEVIRMVDRGANSIYNLLNYLLFSILPTIVDICVAIVYFSIAFSVWFGLIVFVTMTLYIAATILVTEWRTKFRRLMNERDNAAKAKALDSLLNFETVKYYSGEDYEVDRLNTAINDYQVCEWQSMASLALLNTIQNIVIILGLLVGSLYCGKLVADGKLGVGDFVLYITYTLQLYIPLNFFGTYYRMIQQSFIDMENMFDLFSQIREVADLPNALPLNITSGLIEFKNVKFGYSSRKLIIKDMSFTVFPGQTLALVGHSGSGKTTLIRLLYRFYDIDDGAIFIDGQDISKVTQKSLRQSIGVVPQDTVLFNDNIGFNIRYGRLDASDVDVEEAAQAADIHNRILTFPDIYRTIVGERGLKLSGGEKQRVAIARTVLKNPPLVLLDEATSALDTQTERNIQASLNNMCINRTTIVVAHRLSTIVNADQILVIKEGEIMERGRHDELLAAGGMYTNMWLQQQADEKEGNVSSEFGSEISTEETRDEDTEK